MSDLGKDSAVSIEMGQLTEPNGHRRSSSDRGSLLTPVVSPTKPKSFTSLQVPSDLSVQIGDEVKTPSKESCQSGATPEADEFDCDHPVVNKSRLSNFGLPSFLSSTSTPLNQSGIFGHLRRSSATANNAQTPGVSKGKVEVDVEKGVAATVKPSEVTSIFSRIRPSGASKRGAKGNAKETQSEEKKSSAAVSPTNTPNRLSKESLKPLQLSPAAIPTTCEPPESEVMVVAAADHIQTKNSTQEQEGRWIEPGRTACRPSFDVNIANGSAVVLDDSLCRRPLCLPSEMRLPFEERQQQHNFHLDAKDLQQTEANLLQLLNNFNSGKLRAFVNPNMLERMRDVREQQERLARLQFDLYAEQERLGVQTDEARKLADNNLAKLTDGLRKLNTSIDAHILATISVPEKRMKTLRNYLTSS